MTVEELERRLLRFPALIASKEEAERRQAVCAKCEHKTTTVGLDMCGKCGCFLAFKTRHIKHTCPVAAW